MASDTYLRFKQYLQDMDIAIDEEDEEKEILYFYLMPLHQPLKCFFYTRDRGEFAKVGAFPLLEESIFQDPVRLEHLGELLQEFNAKYRWGRWALPTNEGVEVTFDLFIVDQELTRRQAARLLGILTDLVAFQVQQLQLLLHAGVKLPFSNRALSGLAIHAALQHPAKTRQIAHALNLDEERTAWLHDIVGETYVPDTDSPASETSEELASAPRVLLN